MAGESIGDFNALVAPGDSDRPPPVPSAPAGNAPAGDFTPLDRSPLKTSYKQVPSTQNGSGSLWGDFTHGLGLGTRNVVEGLTALPGMAYDVAAAPQNVLNWGVKKLGGPDLGLSTRSGAEHIAAGLDAAGLPTPQTPGEQTRAEFVRGGASMLTPMGLSSMAPNLVAKAPALLQPFVSMEAGSLPKATQAVVAGGTGGVVGDAAANSEYVPEWLKPTARLAGNIAGNVGVNSLASAGTTLLNAFQGKQSEIANALDRLGIKPRTMGAVSEAPGVQGAEATLTRVPTASGVLQPAQRQMVDDFGNAVDRTARLAETSTNPQAKPMDTPATTGQRVQELFRNWRDTIFPAKEDAAWQPVNNIMRPAGDVVDLSGYRQSLQRAAADPRLAALPETQRAFASGQIQKWLDALDADAPAGTKVSWDAAHAIKQQLGDAMGTPDLVGSIGSKALDSLYAGLANDMKISAVLGGAGKQFDAANQLSTIGRTFMNNTLAKGISGKNALKEEIAPDQATTSLLNGTSQDHQMLRMIIPEAADALAAYRLRQFAQAKPSQQGAGDTTSTGTFLTNLRKFQLGNSEGAAALFSDPDVASNVRDLGTAAGQFRGVERNMNTSNTAGSVALLAAIQHLTQAALSGDTRQAGITAASMAAPWVGAKVLTSPSAIALGKAQGATPPVIPGLLGGVISNQAQGPARYDFDVRP